MSTFAGGSAQEERTDGVVQEDAGNAVHRQSRSSGNAIGLSNFVGSGQIDVSTQQRPQRVHLVNITGTSIEILVGQELILAVSCQELRTAQAKDGQPVVGETQSRTAGAFDIQRARVVDRLE